MGSLRSLVLTSSAAAVGSEAAVAPMNTPWSQFSASCTKGMVCVRLPPKMKMSMGTPAGSSQSLQMTGHCEAGAVNRALGWAPTTPDSGVQSLPFQSMPWLHSTSMPSHQMSFSSVTTQLVKMVFFSMAAMAMGFEFRLVPGATPKKPYSGLMARSLPSGPIFIQAISSPMHSHVQPSTVGWSMARFVFPQALGKAAAIWYRLPSGLVRRRMSMCSAIHPSLRAMAEAMRRARHFLPRRAFPPYPEPYDQMRFSSGKWAMYFCSMGAQGH